MKWLSANYKALVAYIVIFAFIVFASAHGISRNAAEPEQVPNSAATTCSPDAGKLLSLINSERSKLGAPVLTVDTSLATAAGEKSRSLEDGLYYGHQIPDGTDIFKFLRNQGVKASASEELDVNALSPDEDWDAFRASSSHYSSLTNASYTRIGISERCVDYTIKTATGPDDNSRLVGQQAKELTVIYLASPEPTPAPTPQYSQPTYASPSITQCYPAVGSMPATCYTH